MARPSSAAWVKFRKDWKIDVGQAKSTEKGSQTTASSLTHHLSESNAVSRIAGRPPRRGPSAGRTAEGPSENIE